MSKSAFDRDPEPDPAAQGQAALLLVESVIHSLLDNGAMTKAQAIEAVASAIEVKEESAGEEKEDAQVLRRSVGLLEDMRESIAVYQGQDGAGEGNH